MQETIKKIKDRLYTLNFDNLLVKNGEELIVSNKINDLYDLFKNEKEDRGFKAIPYFENVNNSGLFYSNKNNKKFVFNHSEYGPNIFSFNLSLFGLKKNINYAFRFKARKIDGFTPSDSNNKIYVLINGNEVLFNEPFNETLEEKTVIYKPTVTYNNLIVNIGKIELYNISIEEVELDSEAPLFDDINTNNLQQLKAYSVVSCNINIPHDFQGEYYKLPNIRGIGISVYYNIQKNFFIVERDNRCDAINDSLLSFKYYFNIFSRNTKEINVEFINTLSPISKEMGYVKFNLYDTDFKNNFVYVLLYELL